MYINPKALMEFLNRQAGEKGVEGVRIANPEYPELVKKAKNLEELDRKHKPEIAQKVQNWKSRKIEVRQTRMEKIEITGDVDGIGPRPRNLAIAKRFERAKRMRMERTLIRLNKDHAILEWL